MSRDLGDVARSGFTKFRHATLYRARPPFGITRPMPQTIAGSVAHSACSPGHDGQSDSTDDMGLSALAKDSVSSCVPAPGCRARIHLGWPAASCESPGGGLGWSARRTRARAATADGFERIELEEIVSSPAVTCPPEPADRAASRHDVAGNCVGMVWVAGIERGGGGSSNETMF